MQRKKLYNSQVTPYLVVALFIFKNRQNCKSPVFELRNRNISFFKGPKLRLQNLVYFENNMFNNKISCYLNLVELCTLHLVVYFVFLIVYIK